MAGYYGDLRGKQSETQVMHWNGVAWHKGEVVDIRVEVFERSSTGGICWKGKRKWVKGIITGFEANWKARPSVKRLAPPECARAGKEYHGLVNWCDIYKV